MKDETKRFIAIQKRFSQLLNEISSIQFSDQDHTNTDFKSKEEFLFFLSYSHSDDYDGRISRFKGIFEKELTVVTGSHYKVFQDITNLEWGVDWKKKIFSELSIIPYLIPIISPSFLSSQFCCEEIEEFAEIESNHKNNDLILPIYYVTCDEMNKEKSENMIVKIIKKHNYVDWRQLRKDDESSTIYKSEITKLAEKAFAAIKRLNKI